MWYATTKQTADQVAISEEDGEIAAVFKNQDLRDRVLQLLQDDDARNAEADERRG